MSAHLMHILIHELISLKYRENGMEEYRIILVPDVSSGREIVNLFGMALYSFVLYWSLAYLHMCLSHTIKGQ